MDMEILKNVKNINIFFFFTIFRTHLANLKCYWKKCVFTHSYKNNYKIIQVLCTHQSNVILKIVKNNTYIIKK